MTDLLDRFAQAVDGMAGLSEYRHVDRRQAWLDRLRVNFPELATFKTLQPECELGYLAPPSAKVVEGGTLLHADGGKGITRIASEFRNARDRAAEPATWYVRAQRARAALTGMFDAVMCDVDVLITPTLRIEPPRSGAGATRSAVATYLCIPQSPCSPCRSN